MDSFVKSDPNDEEEKKPAIDEEIEYQKSCLFCSELRSKRLSDLGLPSLKGCKGDPKINHELWSVFILGNLAQYPNEEITSLLKDAEGLSLSNRFALCECCSKMVKEAMSVFHKILMLEVKLKNFQGEVKQKIEKSSKVQNDGNDTFNVEAEIRKRFKQGTLPLETQNNEYSDHDAIDFDDCDQDENDTSTLSPDPEPTDKKPKEEMTCEICKPRRLYTNCFSYERHQKAHASTQHPCPKCNFPFPSAIQMERHLSKKMCGKNILQSKIKLSRKEMEQLTLKRDFICHLCPFKTAHQGTFHNHVKGHELYDCREIDGKFNCKYCQKDFPSSLTLKRHIREDHHEDHGAPILKCPTCSKIFCKSSTLKFHIAEVHNKQFRFYCEICGYGTMRKFVLDKHMKIHVSERLFVCDLCAASFKTSSNFNNHMRKVHGPSRSTVQHTCKYCNDNDNSTFFNKSLLDRHLKDKHKDLYVHRCDQCENSYLSGASLQLHKKINHSGEQAECQFCGNKLLNRVYLYTHYKNCPKKPDGFKYKYPRSKNIPS